MATFALVHGAWFGGWVWTPLAVELRKMGHAVVAPDMPAEDPDATIADYVSVIEQAIDGSGAPPDDDLILVGHSLGGLSIPVVAEHRPVAGLIFLCAFLPEPGQPMHVDEDSFSPAWAALSAQQTTHDDGSTSWPEDAGIQAFFHDCPALVAAESARKLRRQSWNPANQENPLEALPTVPAAYVLCTDDRVVNPAWSRRVARSRLGVDPIELPGGHAPMLVDAPLVADLFDQMAAGLAQLRKQPPPG
ncbi:MAG TPA: alpha/beta hydrolase [Acidimicrobiales bacterium]